MKVKFTLVVLALLTSIFCAMGQSIQNLDATFLNGIVTVTYDVVGAKPNQTFSLELYGSHNNFTSPLKQVSGDVGKKVTPGPGKKIIWDAAAELVTFNNELTFKVKGEVNAMPLVFLNPVEGGKARRGTKMNIAWEGGRLEQNIKLQLLKENEEPVDLGETKNTGVFAWSIPAKQAVGNYTLKITSGLETIRSTVFPVKPKYSLVIKAIPVAVVAGIVTAM